MKCWIETYEIYDKAMRLYNMSYIRSNDTKPEIIARGYLFARRFRVRIHNTMQHATSDIILKKYKSDFLFVLLSNMGKKAEKIYSQNSGTDLWINAIDTIVKMRKK